MGNNLAFIGIMSGTSKDALDGGLYVFEESKKSFKFHHLQSINFSKQYKNFQSTELINEEITNKSIELVKKILEQVKHTPSGIAFSGQTIKHTDSESIQAGNPQLIADSTGIKVYSDFRNWDIKNGGKGAPLIPAFHEFLFSEGSESKLIINIGGIANGTHLSDTGINIASDIGPGNCLLDYAASKIVNIDFDKDGKIASRGKINKKLFEELINNFPENIYPRADDLKVYTEYFFKNFESFKKLPSNDLFRTLTEVTAEMIFKFFVFCERTEKVIFHGGGTLNSFLMERIEQKIEKKLHTTDDFGVPSKYVESAGFAYLAYKKRSEIFFPK